jgi:hypothetical protein
MFLAYVLKEKPEYNDLRQDWNYSL